VYDAPKIGTPTMLNLPPEWAELTAGAVALALARQTSDPRDRAMIARHLVAASLELAVIGLAKRFGSHLAVAEEDEDKWRIGGHVFSFLPVVDDATFHCCSIAASTNPHLTIIVWPESQSILQCALDRSAGARMPMIFSLDQFISMRTLFSSADIRSEQDTALIALLEIYNRRVCERGMERFAVSLTTCPGKNQS
jgi:hypothetical protein